jgi:hypothetical protein
MIVGFSGLTAMELHFDLGDGQGKEEGHSWTHEKLGDLIDKTNPDWYERAWRRDNDGKRPMRWWR